MKKLWMYMCSPELNNRGEFSIAELSIYEPDEIPSFSTFAIMRMTGVTCYQENAAVITCCQKFRRRGILDIACII
ncbi:MAG: hypothetical protein ACI4ND_01860 [Succinivibrio sp.]